MAYSPALEKLFKKQKIEPGTRIKITRNDAEVFEGLLLPRIESGDKESVIVKLDTGYNVGIKHSTGVKIERLPGAIAKLAVFEKAEFQKNKNLPSISVVATGGTIASRVDYRTGGVHMLLSPEQILATVPELADFVNVKNVTSPFRLASEDMGPKQWMEIAKETAAELNDGAKGVIVTHGTDTLHYTSAALSFLLKGRKPVAVVGAQRSPDRASFDGAMNLVCGAHYAASDFGEVAVVMHGTPNDDFCFAHRGTKVRKMHTSARNAFKSVNAKPLAKIWSDGKIDKMNTDAKMREEEKVTVEGRFDERVALLKVFPGSDPAVLDWYVSKGMRGIVIEGTGLGHLPTQPLEKKKSWLPAVKHAVEKGVVVAVASQCLHGRTNDFVYTNLRLLKEAGAVHVDDTLPETALVKLGWLLGSEKHDERVRELLRMNFAGEINERSQENE
ncbi:MAG TPA: Glu-tRNA(Gln) amidotransferase subunit GatD [Candidatus Norongarragalinales archaeon]|jgi:glutamyl-tRNA(Gln) amidotransferase subunit D|nr:Glu-tRNA(Gln) amidotransferase subunit GatD [Candidatus Norongarragalinales archaeon]